MNKSSTKGLIFVLSAPSGTGKTTLVEELQKELPQYLSRTISCTTRKPREGETDCVDYFFVSESVFKERLENGEFLENVENYGYHYGTPKDEVTSKRKEGKSVILVIDVQGAAQIMEKENAVYIFVTPPSLDELERRIKDRKTEPEEVIEKRLKRAQAELEQQSKYDYVVVNDDFNSACEEIKEIIIKECNKPQGE